LSTIVTELVNCYIDIALLLFAINPLFGVSMFRTRFLSSIFATLFYVFFVTLFAMSLIGCRKDPITTNPLPTPTNTTPSTVSSEDALGFNLSGLVSGSGLGNNITPQPLGNSGLYIRFPSTNDFVNWVIQIPNKKAPDYLSNYNAYQSAVSQAESSIEQATKDLELKKTRSQGSDTDLARAEIISAEGQVQSAQAKFEDTILRAPADGTITSVDLKLGELSEAQKPIITLQDVSNLYVEAKINESNIANVKLGQSVTMTFDAFGTSRIFNGTVVHIDPGATTTDGIVNYKIKASILNLDQAIRTGMNADISILTAEKDHALVIPKAAVISRDDKTYVNVITKKDSQEYKEKEIKTGLTGDGNRIEITNGLSDGEEIAIVSK
jgi:RND family efflux transporter MFP subunit